MPPPPRLLSGHVPGLDGLRAIAVLGVVVFHAGFPLGRGGFLGVDVFFALSGFLITGLLLDEWRRSAGVALGRFYVRRVLRLMPALLFLLSAFTLFWGLVRHDWPWDRDIPVLLLYANWWEASHWGAMEPITHTWSLVLEWQFYLVWPPILVLLLAQGVRRRTLLWSLGPLLVSLTLLRAWAWDAGVPRGRLFYGLDTRGDAILAGVWLAVALGTGEGLRRLPLRAGCVLRVGAWLALGVLGALMAVVRVSGPVPYLGGFLVAALAGCLLIVQVLAAPDALLARALAWKPLVGIGRLSYGIYLWHYPIFELLDLAPSGLPYSVQVLVKFLLSLAAAWISYVLVEQPFLKLRRRPPGNTTPARSRALQSRALPA